MADELRLQIEYKDINGILTSINIYEDGYAGAATVRTANAGIKVEWGDESNTMPIVYGSSCTVYFDSESDYEFLFLFSEDSRKHRVEAKKLGQLFWTGYIEPGSWNEPLIAAPYPVQFTAYDGLGFLKDTKFIPDGRKSIGTIIDEIIANTGLSLTMSKTINWAEVVSGDGTYTDHTIDTDLYKDKSCYEVLEQILRSCRIFQRGGHWHLLSNNAIADTNPTLTDYWVEGSMSMEMIQAVKEARFIQDFGYIENLIINGSFEQYNIELAKFETWTNNSVTPEQRILNDDNDKYVFIPGRQLIGSIGSGGYGQLTNCISKRMAVSQTDSILNLALKYALMGTVGKSAYMFIKVKLIGDTHTYYLRRVPWFAKDQEFEWIQTSDLDLQVITLGSHAEKSRDLFHSGLPYYNTFDPLPAFPANTIADHFENFRSSVVGIPETGILELSLYVPYTNRNDIAGSCFTGVTLQLLDENNNEYPADKTYTVVNSARNNYTPDDLTLTIGDYPDIINTKLIYKGGIRRADESISEAWSLVGSGVAYTFAEFIGRMIVAEQRLPRQNYKARFADVIPTELLIVTDPNNPGKKFVENGLTYDDFSQAVEGQFTELLDVDIDTLTVDGSTAYTYKKPDFINVTANPQNIEERVSLLDKNGARVSAPGYLYENDFEVKKLPETDDDGLPRLQIKRRGIAPYNLDQAAGQLQFSFTSIAEANFEGDPNSVSFTAGKFLIHNYNALDKDDRLTALES